MSIATKTARTIVGSVTCAAGTPQRRALNLATALGCFITLKITNGGTGPTVSCKGRVLVAHNATTPSTGAAGTDWKTIYSMDGGTTASAVTEQSIEIPASVMQVEVEFADNTAQSVTVEAYASELTSVG